MLEYLDVTHLPFVDKETPLYLYRRVLAGLKHVFYLDGNLLLVDNMILLRCQTWRPIALAYTRLYIGRKWMDHVLLLTHDRQEYLMAWEVVDEKVRACEAPVFAPLGVRQSDYYFPLQACETLVC